MRRQRIWGLERQPTPPPPQNSFEKARWSGFLFSIRQLVNFTPISGPFMSNLSIIGRASLRCQISSIQQLKGNLFSKRSQRGKTTFAKIQKRKEKLFYHPNDGWTEKGAEKNDITIEVQKVGPQKGLLKAKHPKLCLQAKWLDFLQKRLGVNKRRVSRGK